MDFPRRQIKANARAALTANYWPVVGIIFLGGVLANAISFIASIPTYVSIIANVVAGTYGYGNIARGGAVSTALSLVGALAIMLFSVGISIFAYHVYRGDEPDVNDLFIGFKNGNLGRVILGMFLVALYVVLWSLLFIIPGIIKSYEYAMMPYLLVDRPDLSVSECFQMSKEMTRGHKWHLFVLDLSFIGWVILSAFMLDILSIFYVTPYMKLAQAGAYDYLKRTRMPQPQYVYDGPAFQSASYEADYAETASTQDTWSSTPTSDDENIFDE